MLYEKDMTGKDVDYLVGAQSAYANETPVMDLIKQGRGQTQALQQWQIEGVAPYKQPATMEGTDQNGATVAYTRPVLKAFWELFTSSPWKVSDLATFINTFAIKSGRHEADQQAKNAESFLQSVESVILSDQEMQEQDQAGGLTYLMRGMYGWLVPALQTVNVVPAAFMPTTSMNHTGTLAAYTEAIFKAQVLAASRQVSRDVRLLMLAAPGLKAKMSAFNSVVPITAATETSIRRINSNDPTSLVEKVDFFQVDGGEVRTRITYRQLRDLTTGADSTRSDSSGVCIDPARWRLGWTMPMKHIPLVNAGGGDKGFHKGLATLQCLNSMGQWANYSTAT